MGDGPKGPDTLRRVHSVLTMLGGQIVHGSLNALR